MATTVQRSILEELIAAQESGTLAQFALSPYIQTKKGELLTVGEDNGNDAYKGSVLTPRGHLVTIRVPTAFGEAVTFQSGENEVTYTIDGTSFWIGEIALRQEGGALPIGPTDQRLVDQRMRYFLAAAEVELLHNAGYVPGEYQLARCFEIPDSEIEPQPDDNGSGDKMGVCETTRTALSEHLNGKTIVVTRTDKRGVSDMWTLTTVRVLPQAQTAGTILAWSKAPNGKTVADYDSLTVINIGGGDLYQTNVNLRPTYQMNSRRLSDGTILLARALARKFPRADLSDVAAQQALITGQLLVSGKLKDISKERSEVLASQGQDLIGRMLPSFQQTRRFVLVTGGGVMLLNDMLTARLQTTGKTNSEDYALISAAFSSTLNSIGALFSLLFIGAKKG